MAQDERCDRIRERHRADDVGADLRMGSDLLEFLRRQRPGLREDVLRNGELPDVVQQRRRLHALDLVLRHAERAGYRGRVELHPANVGLGGLILGVDRERERLDCREMEIRHLPHVPLLVVYASQIGLVGAIREIERRGREHRKPVGVVEHQPGREGCNQRSHEVAGPAPQEVLVPDRENRLTGRQCDRGRDGQRVDDEVGRRRADQRLRNVRPVEDSRHAAKNRIDASRRLHGDDEAGHAEESAIRGVPFFDAERALAVRAGRSHHHRLVRTEQQQRGKVHGVGDRHRGATADDRQRHLEDGGHRRQGEQQQEEPRGPERLHRKAHDEEHRPEGDHSTDVQPRAGRQAFHAKNPRVMIRFDAASGRSLELDAVSIVRLEPPRSPSPAATPRGP